jgi:predicted O-methyltransferase YrrM
MAGVATSTFVGVATAPILLLQHELGLFAAVCVAAGVNTVAALHVRARLTEERNAVVALVDEARQGASTRYLAETLHLRRPLPQLGGWRISADTAEQLVRIILDRKPRLIAEFGSGASTIIMAYACEALARNGHQYRIRSFDHDADYARKTRQELNEHGLAEYASVIHAPLEQNESGDLTYDLARLHELGDASVDLLLVDGPPVAIAPKGRSAALVAIKQALAPGAAVYWDDAARDADAILSAAALVGASEPRFLCVEKGAAVTYLP